MASGTLPEDARTDVEQFIVDWLTDTRLPGAAVAVVDGADCVYAEGFGARTLEENAPATPRTLYGMGSCTKAFTAAAVMQLVEAERLAVEDPVNDYLPHLEAAPGDPITVQELLTHTSGIPAHPPSPVWPGPDGIHHIEVPLSSRADFRRQVEGAVARRVPDDDTVRYYNAGYTMLGLLVEEVTDQPIAAYIDENLLAPLGMARSTFSEAEFEAADDRMTPYLRDEDGSTRSAFPFDEFIHAAGGLLSSVDEMARWLRLFTGDGTVDGERVLAPASIAAMTTPAGTFHTYVDGRAVEYGYGLMVQAFLGDRLVGHGGTIGVSNAYFGYLEEAGLGVTIACATRPPAHVMAVGMAILALLQDADPHAVVPHYALVTTLERACGDYTAYPDIADITVTRDGGTLELAKDYGFGGESMTLVPERVTDDELVCKTVDVDGFVHEARFVFGAEEVVLFENRDRYAKPA